MFDARNGLYAVFIGVIYELILQFLLNSFAETFIPSAIIGLAQALISLAGLIMFIKVTKYWHTAYIAGAILGYVICCMVGLIGWFDMGLFVGILLTVVVLRFIPFLKKLMPIDLEF